MLSIDERQRRFKGTALIDRTTGIATSHEFSRVPLFLVAKDVVGGLSVGIVARFAGVPAGYADIGRDKGVPQNKSSARSDVGKTLRVGHRVRADD